MNKRGDWKLADKQIVDLTEATKVDDNDLFLIQDTGDINKKVTKKTLLNEVNVDINSLKTGLANLSDVNTELDKKISKDKIVNNCTTSDEGYILDARQGTFLYDELMKIMSKTNHTGAGDLNDYKTESKRLFVFNCKNAPNTTTFGFLEVIFFQGDDFYRGGYVLQKFYDYLAGLLYTRTYSIINDTWSNWIKYTTSSQAIKDKPETTVNISGNTGTYTYTIYDGFCTVEFKNISGQGTNIVFAENSQLPIPVLSTPCRLENNGQTVGTIYISGDKASITGHKLVDTVGFGTVQYQVDKRKY